MKRKLLIIFILILAVAGIFVFRGAGDDSGETPEVTVDTSDWVSFSNDAFNFEIMYPVSDWNLSIAPSDPIAPKFNFYIKPQGVPVETPITHHSNISNVSVFPEGIPTEGLIGQSQELGDGWGDNVTEESRIYTLEDGTPFAAYIKYQNTPDSWNESGFVWARLRAENFEGICFENGEEMGPEEQCDPLGNESISIKHRGEVDTTLWPELKESVKSLKFVTE